MLEGGTKNSTSELYAVRIRTPVEKVEVYKPEILNLLRLLQNACEM